MSQGRKFRRKGLAAPPFSKTPPAEQYPRGKLRDDDAGATEYAVRVRNNTVIIAFPKPVKWIGLGYDDVLKLVEILQKRAEQIKQ